MGCSASTSRRALTCPAGAPRRSRLSPRPSTADLAKPSAGRPPPKPSTSIYSCSNKPVLHRSIEPGKFVLMPTWGRWAASGCRDRWAGWLLPATTPPWEPFYSLLQKNVLDSKTWTTRQELHLAIVHWIECTYRRRRRQRALRESTPRSNMRPSITSRSSLRTGQATSQSTWGQTRFATDPEVPGNVDHFAARGHQVECSTAELGRVSLPWHAVLLSGQRHQFQYLDSTKARTHQPSGPSTLDLLVAVVVVAASMSDNVGGIAVADRARERSGALPSSGVTPGSNANSSSTAATITSRGGREQIHPNRFEVLPKWWIVERTWPWLMNSRRLQVDYEGDPIVTEGSFGLLTAASSLRRLNQSPVA
jgi:putative transposase